MQDPAWSRPLLREAQALAGLGRLQAALSIVRQALDLDPGDGQAQQLQAQLARQQGQPKPLPPMRIWTDARDAAAANPVAAALSALDAAGEPTRVYKTQGLGMSGSGYLTRLERTLPTGIRHAPIPVTIVGGFLGAGKTSLVRHVLQQCAAPLRDGGSPAVAAGQESKAECQAGADECRPRMIGVLVNDLAEVNIDADLLSAAPHAGPAINASLAGPLAALSNGCVCCDLRGAR